MVGFLLMGFVCLQLETYFSYLLASVLYNLISFFLTSFLYVKQFKKMFLFQINNVVLEIPFFQTSNTGTGKLWPGGLMRPVKPFNDVDEDKRKVTPERGISAGSRVGVKVASRQAPPR